jgi:hypothetical protein
MPSSRVNGIEITVAEFDSSGATPILNGTWTDRSFVMLWA